MKEVTGTVGTAVVTRCRIPKKKFLHEMRRSSDTDITKSSSSDAASSPDQQEALLEPDEMFLALPPDRGIEMTGHSDTYVQVNAARKAFEFGQSDVPDLWGEDEHNGRTALYNGINKWVEQQQQHQQQQQQQQQLQQQQQQQQLQQQQLQQQQQQQQQLQQQQQQQQQQELQQQQQQLQQQQQQQQLQQQQQQQKQQQQQLQQQQQQPQAQPQQSGLQQQQQSYLKLEHLAEVACGTRAVKADQRCEPEDLSVSKPFESPYATDASSHLRATPTGIWPPFYDSQRPDTEVLPSGALPAYCAKPVIPASSGFVGLADRSRCASGTEMGAFPEQGIYSELEPKYGCMMDSLKLALPYLADRDFTPESFTQQMSANRPVWPAISSSSSYSPSRQVSSTTAVVSDSKTDVNTQCVKLEDSATSNVTSSGRNKGTRQQNEPKFECQVCGEVAAGFHCGAYVCEACKKFYLRCLKQQNNVVCPKDQRCEITKETRSHCQYCRLQKCFQLQMYKPGRDDGKQLKVDFKSIACKVCTAPSSGFHFGAITCEGCKGFFRRMIKEQLHKKFVCNSNGACPVTASNRTACKRCRYEKCIEVGMTLEGTRLGRQSNSVKMNTLMTHSRKPVMKLTGVKRELSDDDDRHDTSEEDIPLLSPPSAGGVYSASSDVSPYGVDDRFQSPCTQPTLEPPPPSFESFPPLIPQVNPLTAIQMPNQPAANFNNAKVSYEPGRQLDVLPQWGSHPASIVDSPVEAPSSAHDELVEILVLAYQELKMLDSRSPQQDEKQCVNTPSGVWNIAAQSFIHHIKYLLKFVKKIPGFTALEMNDRIKLVQQACYPLVLLYHAQRYNMQTGDHPWFNNTSAEKELLLSVFPRFRDLHRHFKHVGYLCQAMDMHIAEYAFLSAILVLEADGSVDLEAPEQVQQLRESILSAFLDYTYSQLGADSNRPGMLLLRISELKRANVEHMEIAICTQRDHPEVEFSQLWEEMFLNVSGEIHRPRGICNRRRVLESIMKSKF